jgi:hypothetical protein
MSLRGLSAVGFALLASMAMGAGSSCNQDTDDHQLLGGASGSGGSISTVESSSSSSTAASSSGAGGSATCPAIERCSATHACPALATHCLVSACADGCCVTTPASAHTKCTDDGGSVCDGAGKCVGCVNDTDCTAPLTCSAMSGTCLAASCTDGVKDGTETDVDCGGAQCQPCADGKDCLLDSDCVDQVCTGGICQAPSCTDGVQNGQETAVDCGGPTCPACVNGDGCKKASDCQSLSCQGDLCVAATCTDGIQDQDETDVDCGGLHCNPCADGKHCKVTADCVDKVCSGSPTVCQAPTCTDGVQNGTETDIDCGGTMCQPCNIGEKCVTADDCVGKICNSTCQCPTGMLDVPIQGGGVYCIDETEVTYAAYNVFYSANPNTANQPTWCSWNLNWTPTGDWPYVSQNGTEPVRYVNWCQALAYCSYAQKRLCGKIGGGSVVQSAFADFHQDQWYNACTSEGVNPYPYGMAYEATVCNGADAALMGPQSFQELMNCEGGTPNLLEMSGNVAEWEDSCSAMSGASDTCAVRGGSFKDSALGLRCDSGQTSGPIAQPRDYAGQDVGIRCCL